VDVDEHRDAAVKASVQSLPTLNIYKAGQIVDQITGIAPTFESDLKEKIESHL
jgi:thioredoxin-like negative regulator of GroEL